MEMPDDTTWTWDEMMRLVLRLASRASVHFGVTMLINSDALFGTWVRGRARSSSLEMVWGLM